MPFAGLIGHSKAKRILANFLLAGKIPHAFVFHGIEGVGKKTLARYFFAALNCRDLSSAGEPCGLCPSCLKVASGLHPDMMLIEPAGQSIRIEQIRDLKHTISFDPLEGRMQMFILHQADQLTPEAANALLKILEEPLSRSVFVLSTARLNRIPLTVLSRCQKIPFLPLPDEQVAAFLADKSGMPAEDALNTARQAAGSIGRAMQMVASSSGKKEDALVELFLAPEGGRGSMDTLDSLGQSREEIIAHLLFCKSLLRDAIVYKISGDKNRLLNRRHEVALSNFATELRMTSLFGMIEQVELAMEAIEQNANRQLTLEVMLVNLSNMRGRTKSG